MNHYRYLIVGGGMTGDAAVRGIRELDAEGSIGMFSAEPDPPYSRPSLSKGLWKGKPFEKIWRGTTNLGVELHLNRRITELDKKQKRILDETGAEYTYDKLLLATGGSPIRLPFGDHNIIYFRDLQDYKRLRQLADSREHFLVIGGGFIGSEISAALTMSGKKVTMVFLDDAIGARIFPKDLSQFLNDYYRQKGVEVIVGDSVVSLTESGSRFTVRTGAGKSLEVNGVVAGIGIRPNVELARSAGIRIDDGIVVNHKLLTSAKDVYAAGDAAMFPHPTLARHVRVEHEDNALRMGKAAGRNMAGANEIYSHVPLFYSDLFELGYEAVGELDSRLETFADWQEPFKKGVIYYLEKKHVRGVLLWNIWKQGDAARALLAEKGPLTPKDLQGKIHD